MDVFLFVISNDTGTEEQVYRLVVVWVKGHESFWVHKGLYDLLGVCYIQEVIVKHKLELVFHEEVLCLLKGQTFFGFRARVLTTRQEQDFDVLENFNEVIALQNKLVLFNVIVVYAHQIQALVETKALVALAESKVGRVFSPLTLNFIYLVVFYLQRSYFRQD